jgi:iron complex outermembrane receptor protein
MLDQDRWASGMNLLFRMYKDIPGESGWRLRAYYDRTNRRSSNNLRVFRDTADVDWRQWWHLGDRHEVMWGAGYNFTTDRVESSTTLIFDPDSRSLNTFSAFIQDTITLEKDRWFFMIGSKFEHNDYTGFEIQPSGRLWWTPNDDNMLWGAISRPIRVPSRLERDATAPFIILPNPDAESEELMAYELGYRRRFGPDFTLDIAAYYNDYPKLLFLAPVPPLPTTWNNEGDGETYGGEVTAIWQAADNWRLEASYAYVDVQIHGPIIQTTDGGGAPEHQFKFRSYLDITDNLEFNSALYYVDHLPGPAAPSYVRLDLGLTWRPTNNLELAVWGLNLLEPGHRETSATIEVERSVFFQASLRF